jgi:cytochrome c2
MPNSRCSGDQKQAKQGSIAYSRTEKKRNTEEVRWLCHSLDEFLHKSSAPSQGEEGLNKHL